MYLRIQELEETLVEEMAVKSGLQTHQQIQFERTKVNQEVFKQIFEIDGKLDQVLQTLINNFDDEFN